MHWITRNHNVAHSIGSRPAVAYEAGEISLDQLRARRAEMAASPPEFPDPHSEAGWHDGVALIDAILAKADADQSDAVAA
jgi:hypothetical protein